MALNKNEAEHALSLLAEVATKREEQLKTFVIDNAGINSDDKEDGECPVLNPFSHAEGSYAIL